MRPRHLLVMSLLLAFLPCLQLQAKPRSGLPKHTALVGTIQLWYTRPDNRDVTFEVTGGPVAGKGWVESEKAKGLLRKGDRLSLYALEAGELGEVTLTSRGELQSERPPDGGAVWGLTFSARIQVAKGKEQLYVRVHQRRQDSSHGDFWPDLPILAAWTKDGSKPAWVTGQVAVNESKKGSRYWKIVAEWLRHRHIPDAEIAQLRIEQVVTADIDGDRRPEAFLSCLNTWGYPPSGYDDGVTSRVFYSYLLMRRMRPGSKQAEIVVLDREPWRSLYVSGFCDLDRDGTAEIITWGQGIDYSGSQLFHWDGKRFREVEGAGGGA